MESEAPLVRGTPADIEAIMEIERRPGFEELVGRWPAERHREEMAKPGSLYLLLRPGGRLEGFALLQRLDDPNDSAYLKRIAVRAPGRGAGAVLLDAMLDFLFGGTAINRLSLEVFPENERARRAYERAGFEVEGLCRATFKRPDGTYRSALLMAVLRRDWLGHAAARSAS
jgi:RimJ/RimL family protein N-acetyltransferase